MLKSGESNWTSCGVLAALADTPQLEGEPGSAYAYTSVGYICLASIVERIAGAAFSEFAHTHIFEPLGMKSSTFWTGPSAAPPTAAGPPCTSYESLRSAPAGDGNCPSGTPDVRVGAW